MYLKDFLKIMSDNPEIKIDVFYINKADPEDCGSIFIMKNKKAILESDLFKLIKNSRIRDIVASEDIEDNLILIFMEKDEMCRKASELAKERE